MAFTIVMVAFLVLCAILTLIILLQSGKEAGMGIFGGGASQTAFGTRRGDILGRVTAALALLFLIGAFALSYLRSPSGPFEDFRKKVETRQGQQEQAAQPGSPTNAGTGSADAPVPPVGP